MWIIITILIAIILYLSILAAGKAEQLREEQEKARKREEERK